MHENEHSRTTLVGLCCVPSLTPMCCGCVFVGLASLGFADHQVAYCMMFWLDSFVGWTRWCPSLA